MKTILSVALLAFATSAIKLKQDLTKEALSHNTPEEVANLLILASEDGDDVLEDFQREHDITISQFDGRTQTVRDLMEKLEKQADHIVEMGDPSLLEEVFVDIEDQIKNIESMRRDLHAELEDIEYQRQYDKGAMEEAEKMADSMQHLIDQMSNEDVDRSTIFDRLQTQIDQNLYGFSPECDRHCEGRNFSNSIYNDFQELIDYNRESGLSRCDLLTEGRMKVDNLESWADYYDDRIQSQEAEYLSIHKQLAYHDGAEEVYRVAKEEIANLFE